MRLQRLANPGNAILEYAVPMAAILITCGVLGTVLDINGMMRGFFVAASGHTRANITADGTFKTTTVGFADEVNTGNGMGGGGVFGSNGGHTASHTLGNGAGGFSSGGFGGIRDGNGQLIPPSTISPTDTTGGNGQNNNAGTAGSGGGPSSGGTTSGGGATTTTSDNGDGSQPNGNDPPPTNETGNTENGTDDGNREPCPPGEGELEASKGSISPSLKGVPVVNGNPARRRGSRSAGLCQASRPPFKVRWLRTKRASVQYWFALWLRKAPENGGCRFEGAFPHAGLELCD